MIMKVPKILLLSGSLLIFIYLSGLSLENPGVLPWNEIESIPLVNHEFKNSETIVADFETTQAKTEFIRILEGRNGASFKVFNQEGQEEEFMRYSALLYLDQFERDKKYELHVTGSDVFVRVEIVREKNPSYVSDFLPRLGINLGLIGSALFGIGGIIFLTQNRKMKSTIDPQDFKKRSRGWYIVSFLLGIFGGALAFSIIQKEDPKKAKECMIIGGGITGIWVLKYINIL